MSAEKRIDQALFANTFLFSLIHLRESAAKSGSRTAWRKSGFPPVKGPRRKEHPPLGSVRCAHGRRPHASLSSKVFFGRRVSARKTDR